MDATIQSTSLPPKWHFTGPHYYYTTGGGARVPKREAEWAAAVEEEERRRLDPLMLKRQVERGEGGEGKKEKSRADWYHKKE